MTDFNSEVEKLTKEIKNLKADKDFVWTLWKRLQLSTPDVADAMSLVVQREKEKNEFSLKELMDEIEAKDKRINELFHAYGSKEKEVEMLIKSKEDISHRSLLLQHQCADLTEKASKLESLLSKQDERNQNEIIDSYENERKELLNTISSLQSQMTLLRDEKNKLRLENVENEEKVKCSEYMKDTLSRLRLQVEDANSHILTQQETIQLLREQLEVNMEYRKNCIAGDGYSSDRTEEYMSTRRRKVSTVESGSIEDERPVSPIEDLNYKVDRLTLHMQHLQQCVSNKDTRQLTKPCRSKSIPLKQNFQKDNQKEERIRKIQFLTQKLSKTEAMLVEEKKNYTSASEYLKKANSRLQSLQLTVKQLRKQIEDNKMEENGWKNMISCLEHEMERLKDDIHNKETELTKLNQNALNDASRIQELLNLLEKTRYELTEKKIESEQGSNLEVERLKDLVRELETEKSNVEIKLSCIQSGLSGLRSSSHVHEIIPVKVGETGSRPSRNKRVKIFSKSSKRCTTKKMKSMQSILNHFSGYAAGDSMNENENKDEEWEDEEVEDECENNPEVVTTERTNTSRSSATSTGTKIARVACLNNKNRRSLTDRDRRCYAKDKHIYRIQESRDQSQDAGRANICTECSTWKCRVASLQQQLKAVTCSRDGNKSKIKHYIREMKTLHSDLIQVKARSERLVDTIKKQTGRIQILMEERRQLMNTNDPSFSHERMWKDIGIDNNDVASIAKTHLDELTSQVSIVRDLHQELSQRDVQLVQLKERLNRIERENSCKKRIIEDLRSKLQCLDGIKDRERNAFDVKDKRCKDLEDHVSRLKTQLESLQTRFNVVLNERKKFEYDSNNLASKLEVSDKKVVDLRQAKQILELQVHKIDQEKETKMTDLISRSDLAIDRVSQQMRGYKIKCSKYENLIVNLSRHLSDKSREIRRLIEFSQNSFRKLNSSKRTAENSLCGYDFARSKAADILSLSTSEIDTLLNFNNCSSDTLRKQNNNSSADFKEDLCGKCKSFFKLDSFEQDIQSLFVEELDKIVELVAPTSSDSGCFSS